jgi:sigma-B regulation protein RsbQ
MAVMSALKRNNVKVRGAGDTAMVFAHGFGCDQNMWRHVAPRFEGRCRTVLFDQVGTGNSEIAAYDHLQYASLSRYADDVIDIVDALDIRDSIFVGHSVAAMIGVLASIKRPELFSRLVLIGPSPCYIDKGDYTGGFSRETIESMLDFLDENYVAWAQNMAPAIMGNLDRPELGAELVESFCRYNADIARQFARVTFLSDNRTDLPKVTVPSAILQCTDDPIAPDVVGLYVHAAIKGSRFVKLRATGHCPNISAPDETIAAISEFL